MATKFYRGIDLRGQRAIGAGDASAATDLVTLQQLQALVRGLDWKVAARALTTGDHPLTGLGQVDGVTLAAGDRVLVMNQTNAAQNGLYYAQEGAWVRTEDADSDEEVTRGMSVAVTNGTVGARGGLPTQWVLTNDGDVVLGTTPLTFAQLGGGATPYTAGPGLGIANQQFSIGAGNGIIVEADGIRVDPSVVARKYAADAAGATNPQTFTHGLGTNDVIVQVWEGDEQVHPGITRGEGTVIIDWGAAPAAGQYRVVVHA